MALTNMEYEALAVRVLQRWKLDVDLFWVRKVERGDRKRLKQLKLDSTHFWILGRKAYSRYLYLCDQFDND